MDNYRYRAATATGQLRTGVLAGASQEDALARIRAQGLMPIEARRVGTVVPVEKRVKAGAAARQALATAISELGTLLGAGLQLDRALRLCAENASNGAVKAEFIRLGKLVKEGVPLSTAMAQSNGLMPPLATAMAEAGEAGGSLDVSLARLGGMLERGEALRQTIVSAMIYPAILVFIAISVILVMLLWIVPQFETLFTTGTAKLPGMTQAVLAASHALRDYGLVAGAGLLVLVFALHRLLRQTAIKLWFDRTVLTLGAIGSVIRKAQTARFAGTLGSLVEAGVALPLALSIAGRTLSNSHMAGAIRQVSAGLKEGAGLSRPLQETKVFPALAISFLRTGEETGQLGRMLVRLAEILERDVRVALDRLVTILTPLITVVMGAIVATVIASIMSAILGFNDLAMGP